MFANEISNLTLTSEISNDIFPNIYGDYYNDDVSFLAALRALLNPRITEEKSVILTISESVNNYESLKPLKASDILCYTICKYLSIEENSNYILLHTLDSNNSENNALTLELIRDSMENHSGFKRLEDLTVFMKKLANVDFHINEAKRAVIIVADRLDFKKYHMLQSLIPRYFPWYFKDNPINDREKELLKSLTLNKSDEYIELIESFADNYDFRSLKITKLLSGFETKIERDRLENIKLEIKNIDSTITSVSARFAELAKRRNECTVTQLGLLEKIEQDNGSEIMDYFLCNKSLYLTSVTSTNITFAASGYLDNYDPEIYERIIKNEKSLFYRKSENRKKYSDTYTDEDIKMFLDAVFDKQILKIKVCAAYTFDIENPKVTGKTYFEYPAELDNCLPNQHVHRLGCLGNNRMHINTLLANKDYITAIEQCVSSTRNINMSDTPVVEYFMSEFLSENTGKFVELPDKSCCTPKEALEWLKNQDQEKGA